MDFLINALTEWLKEMLVGGIMSNLSGMFDSVNQQVADISVQVGQTPQGWNGSIFNMIQNLSETIIIPIAGAILAFVMTLELIQLIVEKNKLHDVDTWMFFKWVFKSAAAILIVTNTWNIVMGVFDVGQSVVAQAAGIIGSDASIDISTVMADMETRLMEMDLGPLFGLWVQSLFIGITMWALYICIFIVIYGRMIEIYLVTHDGQGMGRHGPELFALFVRPGIPGVSHHRVRGDLRRAGAGYRHRGRHYYGHLDLRGLHGAFVFYAFQNRQPIKSSIPGALTQEGGTRKWLMYPYPKT